MVLNPIRCLSFQAALVLALAAHMPAATAAQFKYVPVSPSFGGQPGNSEWVAYNDYLQRRSEGDPSDRLNGPQINLPDFEDLFKDFIDIPTIIIPVYN